jgi:hypothetical protein
MLDNIGIEIYDSKYDYASGSKANRLRAFWQKEPNHVVGQLLLKLLEYWMEKKEIFYPKITPEEQILYDECVRIAERLIQDSPVEHLQAIELVSNEKDFSLLARSIKDSIRNNEPEAALDRLHTFVVKYVRQLCDKHGIEHDRNKPLHSLFGEYVKHLKQQNLIESQMTERILKTSVSVLEAFNDVRNNRSFAHDNSILNYNESMLIFNNIASIINFVQSLETNKTETSTQNESAWEDIPF